MQVSTSAPVATPTPAADDGSASASSATAAAAGVNSVPAVNSTDNATIVQLKQSAAILADGSTASLTDKVNAYMGMRQAMTTASMDGSWNTISQADNTALTNIYENSSVSQQVAQAGDAFGVKAMSLAGQIKTVNVAGVLSDTFNQMSSVNRLMTYAAMSSNQDSLDQFSQKLQANAAAEAQTMAANAKPAVTVTLSDEAKAAITTPAQAGTATKGEAAAAPLTALTAAAKPVTQADVALSLLQNASTAKQKADAETKAVEKTAAAHSNDPSAKAPWNARGVGTSIDTSA